MFGKQGVGVSSLIRKRILAVRLARLFLTVFFLSGILHATRIMEKGGLGVHNSKQSASYGAPPERGNNTLLVATAVNSAARLEAEKTRQPSPSSGCFLASNCTNPVHIPEPEALAVLGTVLLSLASLLRRRVMR
jgi:hypothetical protein